MALAFIRLSGVGLLAVGLAGCAAGTASGNNGGGGGNPTTVTVKITGGTPLAVAAKIGAGAFTAETVTSGSFTLSLPQGTTTFAVAVNCPQVSQTANLITSIWNQQSVFEASTADGTQFTVPCLPAIVAPPTGALTGSVDASAIAGANYLGVAAANGSTAAQNFISGTTANIDAQLPKGSDRVGVGAYVYAADTPQGANSVYTLAALKNFDGVTVPGSLNGGSTVVLGSSDAVTMQPITYANAPANFGAPTTSAQYQWKNGGGVLLSNAAANQYPSVPGAAAEAGDSYIFTASVRAYTQSMYVASTSTTGGPQTFTFPPPWSYSGPAPAALPSFDLNYSGFSDKTGIVVDIAGISWMVETTGSTQNSYTISSYLYSVLASAHYQNGATSLALPDLSGVNGFLTPPASGTQVTWLAEVAASDSGFMTGAAAVSDTIVENSGVFNVP